MFQKIILTLLVLTALTMHSCNSCDKSGDSLKTTIAEVPQSGRVNDLISPDKLKGPIPNPCLLLSPESIAKSLGLDPNSIELKEGTPQDAKDQRACFFRWTDPNYPNSAVLVQVMKNPIADEYDGWVKSYIDSKKSLGEKSMYGDTSEKFLPYNDLGDSGAASFVLKKFYWEVGNELVFLIAYNMDANDKQLKEWTKNFGVELMTNYNKL